MQCAPNLMCTLAYIDHLMAVRHGHHMHDWLMFFLAGVEETARDSAQLFRRILSLKERIERQVLPQISNRRGKSAQVLMQYLYGQPVVSVAEVTQVLDCATNTAATLVKDNRLAMGVLQEVTGQRRNRSFIFSEYIDLFSSS